MHGHLSVKQQLFTVIFSYLYEMLILTANVIEENEPVLILEYRRVNGNLLKH